MTDEELHYEPIPHLAEAEVRAMIVANSPNLHIVPIAVSLHDHDIEFATSVLRQLAQHKDPTVRGNALLGFGHLARRIGKLDSEVVAPLVKAGLRDPNTFVRGQANCAADDLTFFLGWDFSE